MKNNKKTIIFTIFCVLLMPMLSLKGAVSFYETDTEFNPNNIVSDNFLTDKNSMTAQQIQQFVNNKGGTLGVYIDPEVKLPAYFVIWQASQEFGINPKFLLTMLQKEQSLVTDKNPTQNQYDWATGYSCYGGICLDDYKGFSRQVRSTANKFINSYLTDLNTLGKHKNGFYCTFTKWCVGDAKETQDSQLIIPQNKVTSALYTYNPYRGGTVVEGMKVGANYNFWKIWKEWFSETTFRPNGSVLKTPNSDIVYLIHDGKKRPFKNFAAFITRYNIEDIIIVDQAELDEFETGPEIKFAQYSLLATESGDIYLIDGDKIRLITSMEVFSTLGFNPEEVEDVTLADIADIPKGKDLTIYDSYPTGALIEDASSGGVYYVQNGIKYPIFSKEILEVNFKGYAVLKGHTDELSKYPKAEAVKFKDGTLIKSATEDKVYVISDGKKLPIKDAEAFITRGYDWNKIIKTNQLAVDIHPTGSELEAIDTSILPIPTPSADSPSESAASSDNKEVFIEDNGTIIEVQEPVEVYDEVESLNNNPVTN